MKGLGPILFSDKIFLQTKGKGLLYQKVNLMLLAYLKQCQAGLHAVLVMVVRVLRKIYRNRFHISRAITRSYYSLIMTLMERRLRKKLRQSYRQGKSRSLYWMLNTKMHLMLYRLMMLRQYEKQYGMQRLTRLMELFRGKISNK